MVKNRFATKALNQNDQPILVTMELDVTKMDIQIQSFLISDLNNDNSDEFIKKYTSGEEVEIPKSAQVETRSFTEESILPESIKVDGKSGMIRQVQNEWSYLILNAKLYEQFNSQLEDMKQKVSELKSFSFELFEEARLFWENVLEYKKEREISQEKLSYYKEEINGVFEHLKTLKEVFLKEKDEVSEKVKDEITKVLSEINAKMEEEGAHFKTLMDELKEVQAKLRGHDIKRDIKNILFDNIQASFEKLKEKRSNLYKNVADERVASLTKALNRMKKTLELDKKDLNYNVKKMDYVNNKLELQLREAKIKVLEDRVKDKEIRVADIEKTLNKLLKNHSIETSDSGNTEETKESKIQQEQEDTPKVKKSKKTTLDTPTVVENIIEITPSEGEVIEKNED